MERRHQILFEQLKTYRTELLELVSDITEEGANIIPKGFNNNIRWNLGHVCLDQYLWIRTLTKEEIPIPLQFNEWFGFGTSPADFTQDTPLLPELIELLKEQPDLIIEQNQNRMDQEFSPTDMGMHTIEQVLVRTIFHEGLHFGAILALRRHLHL